MTCQSTGRDPIVTIGFGTSSEYPRSRIPAPPQKSTTFMSVLECLRLDRVRSADLQTGDRHHELSAPLPDVAELVHDLFLQIPWKNHDVIGLCFPDFVRRKYRNVRTRHEPPV